MLEGWDARVQAALLREVGARVTGILDTTRDMIQQEVERGLNEGLSPGALADNLEDAAAFSEYRSELIARTESATFLNQAALANYDEFGVTHVEVIDGEGDDECAAANGQIWTLEEANANPIAHPNCVRDFVPVLDGRTGEEAAPAATEQAAPPPTTAAEAQARLADIGVTADLSKLDPAHYGVITQELEALQAQFPSVFSDVPISLRVDTLKGRDLATTLTRTDYRTQARRSEITLSRTYFGKGKTVELDALIQKMSTEGWMGGDSVKYIVDHEFGHIVDEYLSPNKFQSFSHADEYAAAFRSSPAPSGYGERFPAERFAEQFAMLLNGAKLTDAASKLVADAIEGLSE